MSESNESAKGLNIRALRGKKIKFGGYLCRCCKEPKLTMSNWELLTDRIKAGGTADPTNDPYVKAMKTLGIESYNEFAEIRGSESTVDHIFRDALVDQMIVLLGPPGCGKTILTKKLIDLLSWTETWVVDGCPKGCQPINLLRFFDSEKTVVEALGDTYKGDKEELVKLWRRALPPCGHCWEKAYGTYDKPKDEPSIDDFEVLPIRLHVRPGYGLTAWTAQPDDKESVPLKDALRQGNVLCVMRDPFAAKGAQAGAVPQTHILLRAVQEKSLDDSTPHSGVVIAETNADAWSEFKKSNLDPGAYIRRARIVHHGYNRVLSREELAYEDLLKAQEAKPAFDPFALKVVALLAVASRMRPELPDPYKDLDLLTRIAIKDGDLEKLESYFRKKDSNAALKTSTVAGRAAALKEWYDQMDAAAGSDEGFSGLSMSYMLLDIINPLRNAGMSLPDKRVTVFEAIDFLTIQLKRQLNSQDVQGNTQQKELYERCLNHLALVLPNAKEGTPALVERLLRKWVKSSIEEVFDPEADKLRNQEFWQYWQHARASAQGREGFDDEKSDNKESTKVSEEVMNKIESLIPSLTKVTSATMSRDKPQAEKDQIEERKKFRAGLQPRIRQTLQLERKTLANSKAALEPTWETIPELKQAIDKLHSDATLAKIKECLTNDSMKLPLKLQELRVESIKRFQELGYSEESAKEMLAYYMNFELWRSDDRR
jgi:predicted Ser/Thr protein kinase